MEETASEGMVHVGRPGEEQTPDVDRTCFEKARAKGMPTFTLIAQDVTASLVVDFWIMIQARVRTHLDAGATLAEAVEIARTQFGIPAYPAIFEDVKIDGAAAIARAMQAYPNRKLAD